MKKIVTAPLAVILLITSVFSNAQQSERLPVRNPNPDISASSTPLPPARQLRTANKREAAGSFMAGASMVTLTSGTDVLVNNNNGATTIGRFTQSETSTVDFANHVVIAYNDAGSFAFGNHFTGYSFSDDGGVTFTDGGFLPAGPAGDAGDPILARNNTTGRIYLGTLGFTIETIQVFRSDDNGHTWLPPVTGTPGGAGEDKAWMTVDNNAGPGNGNVYLISRRFDASQGLYFFRSLDNGNTFGPFGGTLIAAAIGPVQGGYVAVGPDHSIYVFWLAGSTLQMRRSVDFGVSFGAPITVATGLVGGVNGDLGLTGIRQGTSTPAGFRTSEFCHVAVNPVTGQLYVIFANKPAGSDKADIFMVTSPAGGASWSPQQRVNDDATTTDQWLPTIAVTPDGLNLGAFYYSRQEDPAGNNLFKYYGRIGAIAGGIVTFGPSFPVSDVASLPEFGRDNVVNATYMGDYDVAVGTPTGFSVTWSDNRDDLAGGAPRKDPNVYHDFITVVVVAPTDFYSKASGDLHNLGTWGSNPDGSGTPPSDFGSGKTFHLANRGNIYDMTGDWALQGRLDIPFPARLQINGFSLTIAQVSGAGYLGGSPTSNLTVFDMEHVGTTLFFYPGMNQLYNFTMERGGVGTSDMLLIYGTDLEIYNIFNIVSGGPYNMPPGFYTILKSSAANTARVAPVGGVIAANFVAERYIPARRAWRIMSAPTMGQTINQAWQEGTTNVTPPVNPFPGYGTHITGGPVYGSAANGFDQNPGAASSLKFYSSATDSWTNQPNTNATQVGGTAWMLFIRGDRGIPLSTNNVPPTPTVLRSRGLLNIGDQVFNINPTGFTAVPNPYASPVDFATMTKSNVQNSVWLWDPKMGGANGVGAYVNVSFNGTTWDVTPASVSPESQIIQNGQGFLVKTVAAAPGQLIIKESDKTMTPNMDVFRTARNASGLRINLQAMNSDGSASLLDEVFSSYGSNFSAKIDQMDASKMPNIEENLAIVNGDDLLMVERRPALLDEDMIQLKIWNTTPRSYMLEFTPQNLSSTLSAWIVDNYLQTVTGLPLDKVSNIQFSVTADGASAASDRFRVVLSSKKPQLPSDFLTQNIRIFPNPVYGRNINLQFTNTPEGKYQLKVINSIGQVVFMKEIDHKAGINALQLQLDRGLSKGIYQLQIGNEKAKASFKLLVN